MFTPDLPIHTDRLELRLLQLTDLDAYAELNAIPEVVRYLYWDVLSRDRSAAKLATAADKGTFAREGDSVTLAVVLPEGGELVGHVLLAWTSEVYRSGEVGYVFHPRHAGHGYATEATRALLALGFEGLGLHRIVARADARNLGSERVMQRLGMRREAWLRENEWVKGEWTDEIVYALLAHEWRARGGARPTG